MLFRGLMVTNLSGSMDGLVAAHNHGGTYFRNRTIPTDPETARQVNCREALAACWAWWANTMTQADRDAWARYAASKVRPNRIGDHRTLSGWPAFVRQHYCKFQAIEQLGTGWDPGTVPPIYSANVGTTPTVTQNGPDNFDLNFMTDAPWQYDQDNGLLVYVSTIQPVTKNFFKGPYTLLYDRPGDPETGLAPPYSFASPFVLTPPGRIFYRIIYVSNDQERAGPFVGKIDIT